MHYSTQEAILGRFERIQAGEQVILMGDIFEIMTPYIEACITYNRPLIAKIQSLSQRCEVIYLEGNHDFNLKSIFPNVQVIPLERQPLRCHYKTHRVYLAHGDCFIDSVAYKLFTLFIRNRFCLRGINALNRWLNNRLFLRVLHEKIQKPKTYKIQDFKALVTDRVSRYPDDGDIIIEGHYHQNESYNIDDKLYINLPTFAQHGDFLRFENMVKPYLQKQKLSQERFK